MRILIAIMIFWGYAASALAEEVSYDPRLLEFIEVFPKDENRGFNSVSVSVREIKTQKKSIGSIQQEAAEQHTLSEELFEKGQARRQSYEEILERLMAAYSVPVSYQWNLWAKSPEAFRIEMEKTSRQPDGSNRTNQKILITDGASHWAVWPEARNARLLPDLNLLSDPEVEMKRDMLEAFVNLTQAAQVLNVALLNTITFANEGAESFDFLSKDSSGSRVAGGRFSRASLSRWLPSILYLDLGEQGLVKLRYDDWGSFAGRPRPKTITIFHSESNEQQDVFKSELDNLSSTRKLELMELAFDVDGFGDRFLYSPPQNYTLSEVDSDGNYTLIVDPVIDAAIAAEAERRAIRERKARELRAERVRDRLKDAQSASNKSLVFILAGSLLVVGVFFFIGLRRLGR